MEKLDHAPKQSLKPVLPKLFMQCVTLMFWQVVELKLSPQLA
jgi:hypothetical protein